jgi:hypothetical protein
LVKEAEEICITWNFTTVLYVICYWADKTKKGEMGGKGKTRGRNEYKIFGCKIWSEETSTSI